MKFFTALIIVLSHLSVFSQTCCSGGVPLSNNIGLPFLEKGEFQVGYYVDYNYLNTLKEGANKLDDNNRLRTTFSQLLNFSYNISDRLLIEGLLTHVRQKRTIAQNNTDITSGIGDGILLLRYKLLSKEDYSLSVGLGGKFPIGSTEKVNNQGILLNADLQPGSNAFDLIFSSTLIKTFDFRPTMSFLLRTTYRETGINTSYQGVNDYEFGDEFQVFLGVSDYYFLGKKTINPDITIKYRKSFADFLNDNEIPNTGGEWFFLTPGISYNITNAIRLSTKVEIPVYSYVEGIQLTPTYRFNAGINIRILKKRENEIFNNENKKI